MNSIIQICKLFLKFIKKKKEKGINGHLESKLIFINWKLKKFLLKKKGNKRMNFETQK